jgi:glycosyltransferase involved in cell wall biosynthesis
MYSNAVHLFAMGKPACESLIEEYGVDPLTVSAVGGGLMFDAMPEPSELVSDPTVLFVGRESERKGLRLLLQAFALVRRELPHARLRVVGPRRKFHQPGVINEGSVDRARLAALYASSRVFCMPSRYEPWGLVFVEAMAHGVPCVGTRVQSIPEILDDGRAGLLIEPHDVCGLAEALLQLLTDWEVASRIGLAGRQRAQELYTWEHVAQRMTPRLVALSHGTG